MAWKGRSMESLPDCICRLDLDVSSLSHATSWISKHLLTLPSSSTPSSRFLADPRQALMNDRAQTLGPTTAMASFSIMFSIVFMHGIQRRAASASL